MCVSVLQFSLGYAVCLLDQESPNIKMFYDIGCKLRGHIKVSSALMNITILLTMCRRHRYENSLQFLALYNVPVVNDTQKKCWNIVIKINSPVLNY
jgi:hypothetical protein